MKYYRFEDLPIWQQSRNFVNNVYDLIGKHADLRKDFSLVDQLKRASFSVMLNIAEGFERGGNKEFANFINIAKGSAGEIRAILYILLDNKYISQEKFETFKNDITAISTNLSNLRKYLINHQTYKKLTVR